MIPIIEIARKSFPKAEGLFVTNGFFLDLHPNFPRVLIDNCFRMDVSQHVRAPEYMRRFRLVRQQLCKWRADHPELRINIRQSHRGWRQQCRMVDGNPMPFNSDPKAAWNICRQRTCTLALQILSMEMPRTGLPRHHVEQAKARLRAGLATLPRLPSLPTIRIGLAGTRLPVDRRNLSMRTLSSQEDFLPSR